MVMYWFVRVIERWIRSFAYVLVCQGYREADKVSWLCIGLSGIATDSTFTLLRMELMTSSFVRLSSRLR